MNFFLLACLIWFLILQVHSAKVPKWGKNYYISGTIHLPQADIREPFQAWYDRNNKRVRIDYYNGTVKEFEFLTSSGSVNYRIIPQKSADGDNKEQCFSVVKQGKRIQPLLPNVRNFRYEKSEKVNGVKCDRFSLNESTEYNNKTVTLWVSYTRNNNEKIAHPVHVETSVHYKDSGTLRDHFNVFYEQYTSGDISDDVFASFDFDDCIPMMMRYQLNLMSLSEFVYPNPQDHVDREFNEFIRRYNIVYKSQKEHELRKDIFMHNLRYIHSMNRANLGFKLAVNHFTDQTIDEIKNIDVSFGWDDYLGANSFPEAVSKLDDSQIPENFDWRERGAVGPVRDQGDCGSCWAFAAAGSVEGAFFLKSQKQLSLSVQALMDCSWSHRNKGCFGGAATRSYRWMLQSGGLPTDEEYGPYLGMEGYCHINNVTQKIPISGYVKIPPNNPGALRKALVENGPVAVGLDTSPKSFIYYESGIYSDPECKSKKLEQNHAALLVGYGKLNGKDYWLVKNSWSRNWGMNGYMLMDASVNSCGILNYGTYVTM